MYEESNPLGLEFLEEKHCGETEVWRIQRVVRPTKFQ